MSHDKIFLGICLFLFFSCSMILVTFNLDEESIRNVIANDVKQCRVNLELCQIERPILYEAITGDI